MEKEKILIVSNNDEELMQLISILESSYDLSTSSGGEVCIDAATDFAPDIILIDDMVGDPNCYDICQTYKTEPATSQVTLILMSDLSADDLEQELNNVTADDYLCKPFVRAELLEKIQTLLSFKQLG